MSAYLIYDVEIHDAARYGDFMSQVKPLVEAMGGTYLARGGAHEVLEGDHLFNQKMNTITHVVLPILERPMGQVWRDA